jgi:hypothetical protein
MAARTNKRLGEFTRRLNHAGGISFALPDLRDWSSFEGLTLLLSTVTRIWMREWPRAAH